MSRKNGLKIVKKFDHIFPLQYLNDYCKYFKMSKKEFFKTVNKFKNKAIFTKNYKKFFFK